MMEIAQQLCWPLTTDHGDGKSVAGTLVWKGQMMKSLNGMFAAAIVLVSVGAPAAMATPRVAGVEGTLPEFTQVATKATAEDKARAAELQTKIDAAAKSLETNKRFGAAAVKKDTRGLEAMLRKASGIKDVPMNITYVGNGGSDPTGIKVRCTVSFPPFGVDCNISFA
jgi:hypothetical protein